jgi:hypothetical protein
LNVGCTASQLRRSTIHQQTTLADLQCQQVVDNLARFAANPASLPYFSYAASGSTQVVDTGAVGANPIPMRHGVFEAIGLGGSRTVTEQWGMAPVNNPDKLAAMRAAYQIVLCGARDSASDEEQRLIGVLGDRYLQNPDACLPRGWFKVGKKSQMPWSGVCYTSHCGDVHVWVTADGIDGLSRFTMTILDIATLAPPLASPVVVPSRSAPSSPEQLPSPSDELPSDTPWLRPRETPPPAKGPMFFPQSGG